MVVVVLVVLVVGDTIFFKDFKYYLTQILEHKMPLALSARTDATSPLSSPPLHRRRRRTIVW